jgi:hypothetical protein
MSFPHSDTTTTRQRQVLLFAVGCVVLNQPFLSLFSRDATVGGVPVLVAAIFGMWLLLVVAVGALVERSQDPSGRDAPDRSLPSRRR